MFPVFCAVLCAGATSQALDRITDQSRFRRIINLRVVLVPSRARSHHLGHAARIVAVSLVDLRLQRRPHVPSLDTDRRQA
jgi:hypothetical protein